MKQENLRELLADYCHDAWSGWMNYLFRFGTLKKSDGTFVIDADKVQRWMAQSATPYSKLSEKEKDSDRMEADRILGLIRQCGKTDIQDCS